MRVLKEETLLSLVLHNLKHRHTSVCGVMSLNEQLRFVTIHSIKFLGIYNIIEVKITTEDLRNYKPKELAKKIDEEVDKQIKEQEENYKNQGEF